ncbi:MAG: hypothetical protein R3E53_10075 [Myxococcota bacterium]
MMWARIEEHAAEPRNVKALRSAIETVDPTTVLIKVVSVVNRDWISPVWLVSQAGTLADHVIEDGGTQVRHEDAPRRSTTRKKRIELVAPISAADASSEERLVDRCGAREKSGRSRRARSLWHRRVWIGGRRHEGGEGMSTTSR